MKAILLAGLTSLALAGSANALTLTFTFDGETGSNPGLPGAGDVSGQIVYDTAGASVVNNNVFDGVWSSVDLEVNGAAIQSAGMPTNNRLTQVQLGGGTDAFISELAGGYADTGNPGIIVADVDLEIRGLEIFDQTSALFSSLQDGQSFTEDDIGFISLVINYENQPALGATILRLGNFDSIRVTVSDPMAPAPIPLPAGMPLILLGLGGLALARRRSLS
ncbi:MAG: VPLPA-CTERM sorting domain-containing protein [Pseudomonadota bacterium]